MSTLKLWRDKEIYVTNTIFKNVREGDTKDQ